MQELTEFPNLKTINDIFFSVAARKDARTMLRRNASGEWEPISGAKVHDAVVIFAAALSRLGVVQGDRIAMVAENRWEWAVTDFAALAIGAIDVPIYPTLTPDQTATMIADSGCRIALVSSRKQYEKVASIRERTALEHIIILDEEDIPGTMKFSDMLAAPLPSSDAMRAFVRRARDIQPDEIATIIYTSGTTGEPKGVMLTHGNLASNLNYSSRGYDFTLDDVCISYLPLSHITARHLDYVLLARGGTLAYCPFFEQLPAAMASVRPTVFVAVPRVLEKVMQEVKRRSARSRLKSKLLATATSIGRQHRETIMAGELPKSPLWKLAHKLVFSKVHQVFGGRVRFFVCGGAPLGPDTAAWFADVGIQLLEGYGLTETSPAIGLSSPKEARFGSVGKTLPNIDVRFSPDGELLVRGPSVFVGYWQKPDATAEAFEAESSGSAWFRTGDIGLIDADGFLFITDRKKEMLKTSGGKMIAPQPIENRLRADGRVAHATLIGDRHKFLCALISPNFAMLTEWGRANGIPATSHLELVANPQVKALYSRIVHDVNRELANFEKIKRFHLVPHEWSIETGEMTPSMKIKRRVILERYAADIDALYADEALSKG